MHWKLQTHSYSIFFVKDRIDNKEIEVKYCPTHLMLADFFTKPLNGKLYHTFRDVVMGYKPIYELQDETFSFKERVGNVNENRKMNENSKQENTTPPKNTPMKTYAEIVKSNPKRRGK